MRKILKVAQREYIETVKTKTFIFMILRLSSGTKIWIVETLLSIILLAACVLGAVWIAARVFRTGILMYGKRPGLREVGRWLKQV